MTTLESKGDRFAFFYADSGERRCCLTIEGFDKVFGRRMGQTAIYLTEVASDTDIAFGIDSFHVVSPVTAAGGNRLPYSKIS
jgi:hypothetical protein